VRAKGGPRVAERAVLWARRSRPSWMESLGQWSKAKQDRLNEGVDPEHRLRRDRRDLAVVIRLLGPDPSKTAVARKRLVESLEATGRYAEARPLREQLVDLRREKFGEHHPEVLLSQEHLAINLGLDGLWEQARSIWRRTFEIRLRTEGPDDEATRSAARWLTHVHRELGLLVEVNLESR
jgi:hypothetical protein